MARTRDSVFAEYRSTILEGMARALWVLAYADWVDELSEEERDELGVERARGGQDWYDVAPETPKAANKAALDLVKLYESDKNTGDIVELYGLAQEVDLGEPFPWDEEDEKSADLNRRWKESDADLFGAMLANMALGTGVSWFDDHKEFKLARPHFECHFDGEDLTWSGGISDVREVSGKLGPITILNSDAKDYARHSYVLWFGMISPKRVLIYANSLGDALDELIDWVADRYPGMLLDDQVAEEYNRQLENGQTEERAVEQAEADMTQGGNAGHYINSNEWGIVAEDPTEEQLQEIAFGKKNPKRNVDCATPVCPIAYHEALKADPKKWSELVQKDVVHIEADEEGPAETMDFRDCPKCGSTLVKRTAANPAGLTAKGERLYQEIKAEYEAKRDPRAAEIAARTVYKQAKTVPGLLHVGRGLPPGVPQINAGAVQRGHVPLSQEDLELIGAESGYYDPASGEQVTRERGPGGKLVTVRRRRNPADPLRHTKDKAKTARSKLAARRAAGFESGCDDPNCPGWAVFETARGMGVERCDECNSEAKRLGLPVLFDDEVKHLPEAARELRRQLRET